ncbi:WG repeat-containing protein [Clostridiaceae bacterium M8S5]|nr:WG repeat-containing protein [Clostridiaceae bacterium M8S5]
MKKLIIVGALIILTIHILGCNTSPQSEATNNIVAKSTTNIHNTLSVADKDAYENLDFINKEVLIGKLRFPLLVNTNGITPIAVYNTKTDNEYYGFINNIDGGYVLPIYQYLDMNGDEYFSGGLEPVKKNDRFGFINIKGETVIDFIYDEARAFKDGLAVIKKDGLYGYINLKGDIIIPPTYQQASNFFEDMNVAVVELSNKKQALIDKKGNIKISFDNLELILNKDSDKYSPYLVITNKNKKALLKIENGMIKYMTDFLYDSLYENGLIFNYTKNNNNSNSESGIINDNGQAFYEEKHPTPENQSIVYEPIDNHYIIRNNEGLVGLADKNKNIIIEPQFYSIHPLDKKATYWCVITKDSKNAVIDGNGNYVLEPLDATVSPLQEKSSFCIVENYNSTNINKRLFDLKNKKYIGKNFEHIYSLGEDFVVMIDNNKSGLMNKDGEFVIEPYNNFIYNEHSNGYIIKSNDKGSYITNLVGEKTSNEVYQSISPIDTFNYRIVMNNFKYGLADKDGNLLIPTICKMIKVLDKNSAQIVLSEDYQAIIGTVSIPQ